MSKQMRYYFDRPAVYQIRLRGRMPPAVGCCGRDDARSNQRSHRRHSGECQ